jgi:hypothetical protein
MEKPWTNCAPCYIPCANGQMDPTLAIVPTSLLCMLCGESWGATIMLVCDHSFKQWYMDYHQMSPTYVLMLIHMCDRNVK